MTSPVRRGYFLIADLTGFTAFMAEAELDHGQAILEQVLGRLIASLTPTLRFVDVEGDAVFVYGDEAGLSRGELIAELVEASYAGFRDLKTDMVRNATCPCRACRGIGGLDLKFVAHFGDFVLQELAGKRGPVGTAVNLTHRLLKNDVGAETGWRAYALYTDAAIEAMGLAADRMHRSACSYPHLGTVTTGSSDLDAWYRRLRSSRRERLSGEHAHVEVVYEFDQPPPVVWDWLNDTAKRSRWMAGSDWSAGARPEGRTGARASNHCATSKGIEHVLDWRPFDYYTIRLVAGMVSLLATVVLEPTGRGTRVRWRMSLDSMLPDWAAAPVTKMLIERRMRLRQGLAVMDRLMSRARAS